MMGAGTLGVPRRSWDMTGADAVLPYDFPGAAFLMMGLNGLSAILAALGGLMFVLVVVGSIFFGKRLDGAAPADSPAPASGDAAAVGSYGNSDSIHIPGTVVLVGIFFVAFVLYYFVNWKYLSEVWPLS